MVLTVLAVLSLSSLTWVSALDSCERWTDYLCGDVCINQDQPCQCGEETLAGYSQDNKYYCCLQPADDRHQCQLHHSGAGICPGQKLRIDVQCSGECFNQYQNFNTTGRLGERSQYQCSDGQCVYTQHICVSGYAACRDKSDLKECSDNLQCKYNEGQNTKLKLKSPYSHTECLYNNLQNDGVYDNIGRGDERNLSRLVQASPVNYGEIQACNITNHGDLSGLRCGEHCSPNYNWCRNEISRECGTNSHFTIADPALCGNTTFWTGHSCYTYFHDGPILAFGKRCSGHKQHCYYPWYTSAHQQFGYKNETYYLPQCQDYSDRIFHINTLCNITNYVDQYCQTICNETNKHRGCKQEICQNKTDWISNQTDSFILDPHNCESSCQNPSRGCDACTNTKNYFNCTKSGVCIHRNLLCDGHKNCQQGEDEEYDLCYPTYLQNKIIPEYGTMKCPSIMYPEMDTVAVVCDGVQECFQSTDEPELCSDSLIFIYIISSMALFIVCFYAMERLIVERCTRAPDEYCLESTEHCWNSRFADETSYRTFHLSESFSREMNKRIIQIKYSNSRVEIEQFCKEIFKHEKIYHSHSENSIVHCLHLNLEPRAFEIVMKIIKPGFFARNFPKISKFIEKLREKESVIRALNVCLLISTMIEVVKDAMLTATITAMIGGARALWDYPRTFTATIVCCLWWNILIPLMFNTVGLLTEDPEIMLRPYNMSLAKNAKFIFQFCLFLLSFLNPIFLVNSKQENDRKIRKESGEKLIGRLQDEAQINSHHYVQEDIHLEYVKYVLTN